MSMFCPGIYYRQCGGVLARGLGVGCILQWKVQDGNRP